MLEQPPPVDLKKTHVIRVHVHHTKAGGEGGCERRFLNNSNIMNASATAKS